MNTATLPLISRLGLRQVLAFDGVTGVALGLVLTLATRVMSSLLGVPEALLLASCAILFPSALLMFIAAAQRKPASALVLLIVVGNVLWVLLSLAAVAGLLQLSGFGKVFVAAQAVVVAVLAWLEYTLWRNPT